MASMDVIPVPILASGEPQKSLNSGPNAVLGSENEKFAEQSLELPITGSDSDVVLVDYEENDPENPLNWSSTRKWLIVSAVSWMGFVSVFSTMTITSTAPQILEEFHSHSSFDQTLLVTIWELGEGIGPFFIAPLSERFGRLPVFHVGNFLALCCLVATALSVNIPMVIAFRFLTGCCLSILTLGPAIVGDMFHMEHTGVTMALVMGTQMIADFISPVAGSYIAQDLGWRWSIWLAAILSLTGRVPETYAVVILKRKAKRLQKESADAKQNRSKHQARVDAITIIESVMKPLHILILMLTTSYMTIKYALVSLILATITETMESMYPNVFSRGSIGLTFLSLAIGNTIALIFYSLTSDRCMIHLRKKKGESFEPESRLIHLLLAAIILPMGFLIYGWSLEFHVQYIVPLIVTTVAGFSMTLSTIPIETYVVDVYKIHAASAIGAGVIFRAFAGAFLPLIGPPLYQGIGYGWGNSVLALIAALFIPPLGMLMRYGNWFRSRERFGSSGR
ncbi:uncharacterized protein EAE97_007007 [Botrytis byssoidea]|uniref:Major facilitator superfamily (MFS) profile domain-containing protein n=1 Tax=Botrytis byssoidea TaxID=139641 RepID=A0A9P5IJL7_9HELO|nr:uncharacterized protein EAE97_007007 [Botrytis byssoidea]KAF7940821.1 hypothetical protein EAE97_007007 [Botrytis byssoidea]